LAVRRGVNVKVAVDGSSAVPPLDEGGASALGVPGDPRYVIRPTAGNLPPVLRGVYRWLPTRRPWVGGFEETLVAVAGRGGIGPTLQFRRALGSDAVEACAGLNDLISNIGEQNGRICPYRDEERRVMAATAESKETLGPRKVGDTGGLVGVLRGHVRHLPPSSCWRWP